MQHHEATLHHRSAPLDLLQGPLTLSNRPLHMQGPHQTTPSASKFLRTLSNHHLKLQGTPEPPLPLARLSYTAKLAQLMFDIGLSEARPALFFSVRGSVGPGRAGPGPGAGWSASNEDLMSAQPQGTGAASWGEGGGLSHSLGRREMTSTQICA